LITQSLPTFEEYRRQMQCRHEKRQCEQDVYLEHIRKLHNDGVDLEDLLFFQQSDDYDTTEIEKAYKTHHIETCDKELNKFKERNKWNFENWMSVFLDVNLKSRRERRAAVTRFENDVRRISFCPSCVSSAEIDYIESVNMRILVERCPYNKKNDEAREAVLGIIDEFQANFTKFIPPKFIPVEECTVDEYEDNMRYIANPDERYDTYKRVECGKPRFGDCLVARHSGGRGVRVGSSSR